MSAPYNWDEDPYEFEDDSGDNFSRYVWLALALAIVLHLVVLFFLGKVPFVIGLQESWERTSQDVAIDDQVVVMPEGVDEPLIDPANEVAPPEEAADLLANIDEILPEIRDTDIDISPTITEPEVQLKMERPALSGEGLDDLLEPTKGPDLAMDMEAIGSQELFKDAADGQVVIEEGASLSDVLDPDEFNDSLLKKGAGGLSDKGVMDGFSRLDDLLAMPEGKLTRSKAMIGSDLLFEFGSSTLRESARLSLMKVAMLVELNTDMFCWIEGHTDLIGSEDYNLKLSHKRAAAVRDYLIKAFALEPDRFYVKAYGMTAPIMVDGTQEEQAVNRRVEIKMRKDLPAPVEINPAQPPQILPKTRKAVVVAGPQGEASEAPEAREPVEQAEPVLPTEPAKQEFPKARKAVIVEEAEQAIPYDPTQDPHQPALPAHPDRPSEPSESTEPEQALPVD